MKLLWKLLRRHVSPSQIIGFSAANVIGLAVILCGTMFWHDVIPLFEGRDALASNSYLVISKPLDAYSSAFGEDRHFDESEILEIEELQTVNAVGRFVPSTFEVYARMGLTGSLARMSTDMFFESVPDNFVDAETEQWKFDEGSKYIPIILPRNYLDLYNFGFAAARGLPKISEDAANLLNINIAVRGRGHSEEFFGFIAGFSNRLNTILVPQAFMDYANAKYGKAENPLPSRLIMEVTNPADEALAMFLNERGYVISEGDADSGRLAFFLRVATGMVMAIGVLICALAFFVFALSIYLLLEKNIGKLENLLLLGYSPLKAASPYLLLAAALGVLQTAAALFAASAARGTYIDAFSPLLNAGNGYAVIQGATVAALLMALQIVLDFTVIISKVARINKAPLSSEAR